MNQKERKLIQTTFCIIVAPSLHFYSLILNTMHKLFLISFTFMETNLRHLRVSSTWKISVSFWSWINFIPRNIFLGLLLCTTRLDVDLIPFKVTILICHDCLVNSKCNSNNEISTDLGILNIRTKCVVQIRKRSNNENVSWFQIPKH